MGCGIQFLCWASPTPFSELALFGIVVVLGLLLMWLS
jgi:hypothetical protein